MLLTLTTIDWWMYAIRGERTYREIYTTTPSLDYRYTVKGEENKWRKTQSNSERSRVFLYPSCGCGHKAACRFDGILYICRYKLGTRTILLPEQQRTQTQRHNLILLMLLEACYVTDDISLSNRSLSQPLPDLPSAFLRLVERERLLSLRLIRTFSVQYFVPTNSKRYSMHNDRCRCLIVMFVKADSPV